MKVEVIYALPHRQHRIEVELEAGATVEEAIEKSGIMEQCPEIDLTHNKVGIFARLVPLSRELRDGDRVEIYRPLQRRRDARAVEEKRARIRARKEQRKG
ncbi:MAG: RnfH family protein [Zetaproteobacteria bacterium]|nr:MAG: RnfH family protein [Zetaproteobacteria bacterium]